VGFAILDIRPLPTWEVNSLYTISLRKYILAVLLLAFPYLFSTRLANLELAWASGKSLGFYKLVNYEVKEVQISLPQNAQILSPRIKLVD